MTSEQRRAIAAAIHDQTKCTVRVNDEHDRISVLQDGKWTEYATAEAVREFELEAPDAEPVPLAKVPITKPKRGRPKRRK